MLLRRCLWLLLAVPAVLASGEELPARVEINLRLVLWQPLPDVVKAVFVGPDQRVWYELDRPPAKPPEPGRPRPDENDAGPTKRLIEREFAERSPQVVGARPCLFEKGGGRVWFVSDFPHRLLGWDGRTWVEHDPNEGNASRDARSRRFIRGNLPGHGRWYGGSYNAQIGSVVLFLMSDGVTA